MLATSTRINFPFFGLDLSAEAEAKSFAQRVADKTGRKFAITDDKGNEVYTVKPALRGNEVTVFRQKDVVSKTG